MYRGFNLSILLFSCDFFNVSIKEYFEENTSVATITRHTFLQEFPKDKEQKISIPSDNDYTISFDLANLKQFTINPSIDFIDSEVKSIYEKKLDKVVIEQSQDKRKILLTLKKDFLIATENGKDLDATIILKEGKTGRDFPQYELTNIRSNSVPPQVDNLTIMQTSFDGIKKYVLCFNMPLLKDTVHQEDSYVLKIRCIPEYGVENTEIFEFNSSAQNVNDLAWKENNIFTDRFLTTAPENLTPANPSTQAFVQKSNSVYLNVVY